MPAIFSAANSRRLRLAVAAAAIGVTTTGCLFVNDDGPLSLPANDVASHYPSVNTVDSDGADNVLDALTVALCGVTTASGQGADIVLQSPTGQKVLLGAGVQAPLFPENIVVGGPELIGGLLPLAGARPAVAHAVVAHHRSYFVPRKLRTKVMRMLAKRSGVRYPAAKLKSSVAAGLGDSLGFEECLDTSLPLVLLSGDTSEVSLPSPAPAGPYATSLGVFQGENPLGAWKLWVNSSEAAPTLVFHPLSTLRLTPQIDVTSTPGGIESWYLLMSSHNEDVVPKPFQDDSDFTVTGDDTTGSPLTFTMRVQHKDAQLVTPTGQVEFIECTTPLCDGNSVGTAPLRSTEIGTGTATLTLPAGSSSPGLHRYKAVYYGDPNFPMVMSDPLSITLLDVPVGA